MGSRNILFLAIAVGVGLIAVLLANAYFSGVDEQQARLAEERQMARIVVASQPLEFGSPLSGENLRLQNFPASSVPQGAFFSMEEVLQGGRVALRPIVPGEPVLADKVSGSGGRAVLSANLPEGMRAVSIPINAVAQVAGFVRPGDSVDVMMTFTPEGAKEPITEVVMERVQVLAIDQVASESAVEPSVGSTATMLVDLFGAQKLTLAQRIGQLSLALRNVENQEPGAGVAVTSRDLGSSGAYYAANNRRSNNGMFAPSVPDFTPQPAPRPAPAPAPAPQQAAAPAAPPRPSGPSMTVIRGTDTTDYAVERLGGR